jgi:hypothetical protein
MKITNAKYTQSGSISATVDDIEMTIPIAPGNRHYNALIEQGIAIAPYVEPEPIPPTEDQVRTERNRLLAASDWIVAKSYETNQPVPTNWAEYRQTLRDITAQAGFPKNVTWPAQP